MLIFNWVEIGWNVVTSDTGILLDQGAKNASSAPFSDMSRGVHNWTTHGKYNARRLGSKVKSKMSGVIARGIEYFEAKGCSRNVLIEVLSKSLSLSLHACRGSVGSEH
ncbi:hypothetical protein CROQUDRAFT_452358 [Cronartium quercuum f. sp. fusiforme G11]|uniref:Uncharacterized protein n=1 Tax=Cronartium quercuum f. sp. fusiforme G11 TaxID=708437 RepID=A0A9P6TDI3_9BASI|nr:hypothetical protein CROQUDRAFT_452358 [Cronartium quercuum f. sp. fusiforme G11]